MSKPIRQESPLADRKETSLTATAGVGVAVQLCERAFLGHINLRGDPSSSDFIEAVRQTLDCPLPLEANRFIDAEKVRVCWLGPSEWLVTCAGALEEATAEQLRRALKREFTAVTEIGGGQTVLGISGSRAPNVIAKGCTLDLHPRVFGPGHCAQTSLARAAITILQTGAAPSFELIVRRSYADYVWRWLMDAAAEYGCAVVESAPWLSTASPDSANREGLAKTQA